MATWVVWGSVTNRARVESGINVLHGDMKCPDDGVPVGQFLVGIATTESRAIEIQSDYIKRANEIILDEDMRLQARGDF